MQKKITIFFTFFFFLMSECKISTNFFLALNIKIANVIDPDESCLVTLYYKGLKYSSSIKSLLGGLFNLREDGLKNHVVIIVGDNIACKERDGHVVGFTIPDDVYAKRYDLWYLVQDGGVSYTWRIEESICNGESIPTDSIIFLADYESVKIKYPDSTFAPYCPQANGLHGIMLLPQLVVSHSKALKESVLLQMDFDRLHVPSESSFY